MLGVEPHQLQHLGHPRRACVASEVAIRAVRRYCSDPHARMKRGIGVLEHELDLATQCGASRPFATGCPAPRKQDLAAGRLDQPQHAAAERGLAAAGFADEAQRLAGLQIEGHTGHGGTSATVREIRRPPVHRERRFGEHPATGAPSRSGLVTRHSLPGQRRSGRRRDGQAEVLRPPAELSGRSACACGQRGWKAQPPGWLPKGGGNPSIENSRSFSSAMFGIEAIRPRV